MRSAAPPALFEHLRVLRGADDHGSPLWDTALADLGSLKDRALEAAAEGITISDYSAPDNPIIFANKGFERLTGYSLEEVLGRNCRFLQGPDTDTEAVTALREAVRNGGSCKVELKNYRKDGSPFWNELSITPIRDDLGEVTHFIGIQTDTTERRRSQEELLRARRELERAYRRVSRSLDAAAVVQRSLLPSHDPEVPGLEIAWTFEPCEELAGDGLGIVPLDEKRYGIYLLDVSGHGVPAALLAVSLSRMLSSVPGQSVLFTGDAGGETPRIAAPAEVAHALNERLPFDLDTRQYLTLFYGVLDVESRRLRYVSAGHPPAVLARSGAEPRLLPAEGLPIGLIDEVEHDEHEVELAAGDRLYLYTDGLLEAARPDDAEFGPQRLLDRIARLRSEPLKQGVEELPRAARRWTGRPSFDDDVSVLAFEIAD